MENTEHAQRILNLEANLQTVLADYARLSRTIREPRHARARYAALERRLDDLAHDRRSMVERIEKLEAAIHDLIQTGRTDEEV